MAVIAHLSDPHFGTEQLDVQTALLELLKQFSPDLVVLSGDITQRARRAQFAAAARFVATLAPVPWLAVPGNHDLPLFNLPARFGWPYAGYRRVFGAEREPLTVIGEVTVMGCDATSPRRFKNGYLDVERLRQRLRAVARPLVLVVHQPLDCPKPMDVENLLAPGAELAELLSAERVDLVLSGHIHDPMCVDLRQRYGELVWSPVLSLAGTALSTRIRADAPNSFHFIRLSEDELRVERFDWQQTMRAFSRQVCHYFRRHADQGWLPGV